MASRYRAQSVYSLNLSQETVIAESNVLSIASPLDKDFLAWLSNTTSNLWPLIRIHDDQLAQHIYEQNFNHGMTVTSRSSGDKCALTSLCGKYGPLGHETTFALVSETAWVTSYRQHYVFEGPDAAVLDHIAQAFAVIKRNLMEADRANDHLFDTTPTNSPPRSHQYMMGNGNRSRSQEHEAKRIENGAPIELLHCISHDKIDEEVEADDLDDDDDSYEDECGYEDSNRGSYRAHVHSGWD